MKKRPAQKKSAPAPPTLALDDFQAPPEDQGLSLEELSTAYAELLQRGSTPYAEPVQASSDSPSSPAPEAAPEPPEELLPSDADCDLSPRSILEAMLFVGNVQNQPL